MMDDYCKRCHADVYESWFHSAHRFSSFNNPAYLASVRETRKVAFERDGNVKAAHEHDARVGQHEVRDRSAVRRGHRLAHGRAHLVPVDAAAVRASDFLDDDQDLGVVTLDGERRPRVQLQGRMAGRL